MLIFCEKSNFCLQKTIVHRYKIILIFYSRSNISRKNGLLLLLLFKKFIVEVSSLPAILYGSSNKKIFSIEKCMLNKSIKKIFYSLYYVSEKKFLKGRSRISMVCVPPLGFDPYCEGKWLPLQDKFTPSINSKIFFYKSYEQILKN